MGGAVSWTLENGQCCWIIYINSSINFRKGRALPERPWGDELLNQLHSWHFNSLRGLDSSCGPTFTVMDSTGGAGLPGANFPDALVKETKCSWEKQSCFQLNLSKNLLHDWVEAERKFAGKSLPLTCTKINGSAKWRWIPAALIHICLDLIPSGITLSG